MTSIVCRVCLDGNVKMHSIQDHKLLEIYEKLSSSKLNTEDGLPTTICYICVSQLQRCRRFSDMACESTRTLTHQLHSGVRITSKDDTTENLGKTHRLMVSTITHVTLQHYSVEDSEVKVKQEQAVVKTEPGDYEELLDIEESRLDDVDEGSSQNIEQPLLQENSDQNQYVYCVVCNPKYILNYNRLRHIRAHNGEKPYACNICKKTYYDPGTLRKHMLIHTREKPYACDLCKKAFNKAGNLKQHMLTHTGEKPYACNLCKKAFNQAGNLKQHMLTHTKEKPYSCDICEKTYKQAGIFKKHMLKHTRKAI